MIRGLAVLNCILLVALGILWRVDVSLETRREARRVAASTFHTPSESLAVTDVRRIDLTLPGMDPGARWTYVRRDDGWHLPQHRDGFALGQELDGFLKALLESRGTVAGRVPADAKHFGIEPGRTIEAELFDASGGLRLRAICGRVAPGQRSTECFLTATGRDSILHMRSNPRAYLAWSPESRLPPLLDTRVIPLALGRGPIRRITFSGDGAPAVREIVRREIPPERQLEMGAFRGPVFEWFEVNAEGEKRINDEVSFQYAGFLANLTFDELLGPRSGHESALEKPSLTIAIDYDGDARSTLTLGTRTAAGLHYLHHSTTDQVSLIAGEKARGLVPDVKALLAPSPPRGDSVEVPRIAPR